MLARVLIALALLLVATPSCGQTVDSRPRVIRRVQPMYPKPARDARIEGTVRLAAMVDEGGFVRKLKLVDGHPLLVEAAASAASRWRFRPAIRKGAPVPSFTIIEINFRLNHSPHARIVRVSV
jgi:protein TonB